MRIANKPGVPSDAKAIALASELGTVMVGLLKIVGCIASIVRPCVESIIDIAIA